MRIKAHGDMGNDKEIVTLVHSAHFGGLFLRHFSRRPSLATLRLVFRASWPDARTVVTIHEYTAHLCMQT